MKVIDEGHEYQLNEVLHSVGDFEEECGTQTIKFVKRFRGEENHHGVINQELLRVLIDRVIFLDNEVPWDGNKEILHHLRMALVLHESRALFRKVGKGDILPENIETGMDGHFKLTKNLGK